MKIIYIAILAIITLISHSALFAYSIVFIHVGPKIPSYASIAVEQARLFNPQAKVVFIASESALQDFDDSHPDLNYLKVTCESLVLNKEHLQFIDICSANPSRDNFWRYTNERFLYLNDFIEQYDEKDIFHLEYDVMLYANLEELLPVFHKFYKGIGATFDNDKRCVPGFVYIANKAAMKDLAQFFCLRAPAGTYDMKIIAEYKQMGRKNKIEHLPIIMKDYVKKVALYSLSGLKTTIKDKYCYLCDEFNSIFDAAALGQFLGGFDPKHGPSKPGFINESCLFNSSLLTYTWEIDSMGRKVPYASYKGKSYRINNLHIHSKQLDKFVSK